MKLISTSEEVVSIEQVGGKGHHLQKLIKWGANVAPFFIITTEGFDYFQYTGQIHPTVSLHIKKFLSQYGTIVLRSSMIGEDQLDASFAGLFDTILGINVETWEEGVKKIYASLKSLRVQQYISQKAIQHSLKMAIVVQQEIQVEKSGVLFTRAPIPPTSLVAIDAAWGMGEGVVSGHVEVDHYLLTRLGEMIQGQSNKVLTEEELKVLFKESLRLEKEFGKAADVEWGIQQGSLYIFQIRPITRSFSPIRAFADTNLSESYPASVSPFTAAFVQKAYENVFLEAAQMLGIKGRRYSMLKQHCSQLISCVDDHLYYNLEHYYAVLRSLPGGEKNIDNWHKMIGGKIEGMEVPYHATYPEGPDLVTSIHALLNLAFKRKSIYPRMLQDLDLLSQSISQDMTALRNSKDTVLYLRGLLERPLNFGLTIINDFFIMIGLGILSSALKKKGLSEDSVIDLLKTSEGLDSIKPLQAFDTLVGQLTERFIQEFEAIETPAGLNPYQEAFALLIGKGLGAEVLYLKSFLDQYGDRSFEELKLESLPLKNDPNLLKKMIRWGKESESRKILNTHATKEIDLTFIEQKILSFTRDCIEFRETTRLWRGRFYHFLRQLVIKLAENLMNEDERWKKFSLRDFFSLSHLEWESFIQGKLTCEEIEILMVNRNWQSKQQTYPEFVIWSEEEKLPRLNSQTGVSGNLKGQGVSPGQVEAMALVLDNPTDILDTHYENFILVTRNTDPAWVYIMSRSKGLISEKGSLLSHTAIIGRELGIPTLVGVKGATHKLKTGDKIRIDGHSGEIEIL